MFVVQASRLPLRSRDGRATTGAIRSTTHFQRRCEL
jgi:hypothetical protein